MPAFTLRPAREQDFPTIRRMVRDGGINPMSLAWERFVLAEDVDGEIIACGQIKPHGDGTHELASIVVLPGWRGRGAARAVIEHLISGHKGELFLTCREQLGGLYEKFGFNRLEQAQFPPYFRRVFKIFRLVRKLGLVQEDLWVMKRAG